MEDHSAAEIHLQPMQDLTAEELDALEEPVIPCLLPQHEISARGRTPLSFSTVQFRYTNGVTGILGFMEVYFGTKNLCVVKGGCSDSYTDICGSPRNSKDMVYCLQE
ncbi:hypothetical protein BTVI_02637 [Pitangus sulphuratus]|nr:hypothetical protein BTVI_02637 [Pitangus sulphuratus]